MTPYDTTQHNMTQHNTTWHDTTQHDAIQPNTTQHNTTQHNMTQHNTTQIMRLLVCVIWIQAARYTHAYSSACQRPAWDTESLGVKKKLLCCVVLCCVVLCYFVFLWASKFITHENIHKVIRTLLQETIWGAAPIVITTAQLIILCKYIHVYTYRYPSPTHSKGEEFSSYCCRTTIGRGVEGSREKVLLLCWELNSLWTAHLWSH